MNPGACRLRLSSHSLENVTIYDTSGDVLFVTRTPSKLKRLFYADVTMILRPSDSGGNHAPYDKVVWIKWESGETHIRGEAMHIDTFMERTWPKTYRSLPPARKLVNQSVYKNRLWDSSDRIVATIRKDLKANVLDIHNEAVDNLEDILVGLLINRRDALRRFVPPSQIPAKSSLAQDQQEVPVFVSTSPVISGGGDGGRNMRSRKEANGDPGSGYNSKSHYQGYGGGYSWGEGVDGVPDGEGYGSEWDGGGVEGGGGGEGSGSGGEGGGGG